MFPKDLVHNEGGKVAPITVGGITVTNNIPDFFLVPPTAQLSSGIKAIGNYMTENLCDIHSTTNARELIVTKVLTDGIQIGFSSLCLAEFRISTPRKHPSAHIPGWVF
jgi:hypothetical protein